MASQAHGHPEMLEELKCEHRDIQSLDGIEGLARLTAIDLDWESIEEIGPLSQMRSLTRLSFIRNGVRDLSALALLRKLRYLDAGYNRIEDIGAIAGLGNLECALSSTCPTAARECLDLSSEKIGIVVIDGILVWAHATTHDELPEQRSSAAALGRQGNEYG